MLNDVKSGNHLLRVQIYNYLQEQMRLGVLEPGSSISVNKMIKEFGVSRTPLREALLLLQEQGFVTIQPQRGVVINSLGLEDVKEIYEILGGIESRVIISVFDRIGEREIQQMEDENQRIESTLAAADIIKHNQANIDFHDIFLNLSDNDRLLKYVKILKLQLYDFPRRDYGKQWNIQNLREHREFVQLIKDGQKLKAADYMRDVHWAFEEPDSFAIIPSRG